MIHRVAAPLSTDRFQVQHDPMNGMFCIVDSEEVDPTAPNVVSEYDPAAANLWAKAARLNRKVAWHYVPDEQLEAAFYDHKIIAQLEQGTFETADPYQYVVWFGRSLQARPMPSRAEAIAWVERNAEALYRGEVV